MITRTHTKQMPEHAYYVSASFLLAAGSAAFQYLDMTNARNVSLISSLLFAGYGLCTIYNEGKLPNTWQRANFLYKKYMPTFWQNNDDSQAQNVEQQPATKMAVK